MTHSEAYGLTWFDSCGCALMTLSCNIDESQNT